jgi:GntR family transcriptional regulator
MKRLSPPKILLPPISSAAPTPLYQQIVDGIKREIGEGRIRPGSALPSFRSLAEELLVSVITVKRAYEELEREGIIYRKQGLGTFVAEHAHTRARESRLDRVESLLRQAVREAREAGMTEREVLGVAQRMLAKPEDARLIEL